MTKSLKELEDQIQKAEEREASAKALTRKLKSEHNKVARKERNHRLIQKGLVVERAQAYHDSVFLNQLKENNLPFPSEEMPPRKQKKEDETGYETYIAQKNASHALEEYSKQKSPKDTQNWLMTNYSANSSPSNVPNNTDYEAKYNSLVELLLNVVKGNNQYGLMFDFHSSNYPTMREFVQKELEKRR